jgi:hypothetical protein
MSKFVNIAGQLSDTMGTGTLTLITAIPGYIAFSTAGVNNGDTIGYVIWDNFGPYGPESREVGRGVYDNNTLTRDSILTSTEPDHAAIECTGNAQVYVTALAEDIRTAYISDIAPENPYNGQLWWDMNTGNLYVYYRDGDSSQWVASVNLTGSVFPDQDSNSGKFLSTDGSTVLWDTVPELPDITGNDGMFLYTDGSTVSWMEPPPGGVLSNVYPPQDATNKGEWYDWSTLPRFTAQTPVLSKASQWQFSIDDPTFTSPEHDTGVLLYEPVYGIYNSVDITVDTDSGVVGGNTLADLTLLSTGDLYWRVRFQNSEDDTWTDWTTPTSFYYNHHPMIVASGSSPGPVFGQYDSVTDTGYYGFVDTADLITGDALATQIGLTAGTAQFSTSGWFKFYVGPNSSCNRTSPVRPYVIYVASMPYRYNLSWDHINGVNAVYGDRTETIGSHDYRVRLIQGATTDPTATSYGTTCADDPGLDSEWNELFYRIHTAVPDCSDVNIGMEGGYATSRHGGPQSAGSNWAEYTNTQTGVLNTFNSGSACWTQETDGITTSRRVYRGNYGLAIWTSTTSSYSNSDYGWRPVLELA